MGKRKFRLYRTYLIRCWRQEEVLPAGQGGLRFSLREILAERREFGFGSYEELTQFLYTDLMREDLWVDQSPVADE